MKNLLSVLTEAKLSAESLRSLTTVLTKILEIEEDGSGVSRLVVGTQGNRIEFSSDEVAIADEAGRRIALEELVAALDYLSFLRNLAGLTPLNLPKSLLGMSGTDAARAKAIAALRGNDQVLTTNSSGDPTLTPKANFIAISSPAANSVYRTDGAGATTQEARSAYQNQSSILDAIAALTLSASKVLGTDSTGAIALASASPSRLAGEVRQVAFSVTSNPWVDPDGYYWYVPDGTAISNSNSRYLNLYTALWSTTTYVVSGGRGASAAADWAAGKLLTIPDMRGRSLVAAGSGSGLTNRNVAATWGAESVTLSTGNMPLHNHALAVNTINATGIAGGQTTGYGVISLGALVPNQQNVQGNRAAANDGLGAIRDNGSGTAFSISNPSVALTTLIWMNTK